jgi:hypothetical protein
MKEAGMWDAGLVGEEASSHGIWLQPVKQPRLLQADLAHQVLELKSSVAFIFPQHKAVNANANEKGGKKCSRGVRGLQKIRKHYVAGSGWQWQAVTDDGEPDFLTCDFITPYFKMPRVAAQSP